MRNTEKFYLTSKEYHKARAAAVDQFIKDRAAIEGYKGSQHYEDEMKKIVLKRDNAVNAASANYRKNADWNLSDMDKAARSMKVKAPSDDALKILQALKMREKIEANELEAVGEAMEGNYIALSTLHDIAEKHGINLPFRQKATGINSPSQVLEFIKNLRDEADDDASDNIGVPRAARIANRIHGNIYGHSADYDEYSLPRKEFPDTLEKFYNTSPEMLKALDGEAE